jgi:hypothetical protein
MQRIQVPTLVNFFIEQFIPIPHRATFRVAFGPFSFKCWAESESKRDILLFYLRYPFLYNIILIFILILLTWLWPSVTPFGLFAFWTLHGSFLDIVSDVWPIFAWGAGWLLLLSFLGQNVLIVLGRGLAEGITAEETHANEYAESAADINDQQVGRAFAQAIAGMLLPALAPLTGVVQSIWYSIIDGIKHRWISFYFTMLWLTLANFLLWGFANNGMLAWLYLSIVGPLVDFITFGKLHTVLFHPGWGWGVGAAIVILSFRGFQRNVMGCNIGFTRFISWPVGLFLFLIMLKYGLFASMLVHCVYEAFLIVLTALLVRRLT